MAVTPVYMKVNNLLGHWALRYANKDTGKPALNKFEGLVLDTALKLGFLEEIDHRSIRQDSKEAIRWT